MRMSKEGRRRVRERKEICPNANKLSTKPAVEGRVGDQMAPQYRYESYTDTVETFNFSREMVCQHHVTVDMEHRLPGLGERRLLNEATVPTVFVHRTKSSGPKRRVGVAREEGSR